MPGVKQLFRCVGEAVCANGLKALAGLVPLGAALYDIAENACQRLREASQEEHIHALVAAAAVADPDPVRADAQSVANGSAADQPLQVRERLAAYLQHLPAAVRQSLRRPADPAGRSVPPNFTFNRPEDLLQLL